MLFTKMNVLTWTKGTHFTPEYVDLHLTPILLTTLFSTVREPDTNCVFFTTEGKFKQKGSLHTETEFGRCDLGVGSITGVISKSDTEDS